MQFSKIGKHIYLALCFIVISSIFLGCSKYNTNKEEVKSYKTLVKSYSEDKEYRKNTDSLQKGLSNQILAPLLSKYLAAFNNSTMLEGIPIPTYHCIDTTIWGYKPLFVSPSTFDEQMKYLKDQGYTAITFNDLDRIDTIKKPVLITFDDGYEDNFTNAYPILKKYGLKATIFLVEHAIGKPKCLKIEQIKQMQDIIDFESHTMTHQHLAKLDSAKIAYELSESKKKLEALLNKKIDVIAYPYGSYDDKVIEIAKKYYKYGLTVHFGKFYESSSNDFQIKRMSITNQTNFPEFMKLFK